MAKRRLLSVPSAVPASPPDGRAVQLPNYLRRVLPAYGAPGWLHSAQWRQFVRNQPLAVVCRDTLLNNLKALEWDIVASEPEEATNWEVKQAIRYYRDLFEGLDGDFDLHIDVMGQDYLDLPFGACSEVIRETDDKFSPVLAVEHIDASTLWPTLDDEYPVMQQTPNVPASPVIFPASAVNRMIYSPRPELLRKGWGMAPPEKVYLALEMLYRGDTYYWKLLLDTPEAGVLDLLDMTEESANKWLEGMRSLFQGIDPMKVPVLYEHTNAAVWIPFGRPPTDMLYDKAMLYYGQVLTAGYGLRISDIGLEEGRGGGTLAGVIRAERQTRRTGLANLREAFRNYFNRMLPKDPYPIIKFIWIERDDEAIVARGRSMIAMGQAFQALIGVGVIDRAEARQELVASGLMETDIDPQKLPAEPVSAPQENPLLALLGGRPQLPPGVKPLEAPDMAEKVPASDGGRQENAPQGFASRVRGLFRRRAKDDGPSPGVAPGRNPATADAAELLRRLDAIMRPGLERISQNAESDGRMRLRKLVRIGTEAAVERVRPLFRAMDDETLAGYWLVERNALTFGQTSEVDSLEVRQDEEAMQEALSEALSSEDWWQVANEWDKEEILDLYIAGFQRGAEDMAVDVARELYARGLIDKMPRIRFDLKSPIVFTILESRAGDMVTHVDAATATFIKRIVTAGVRQGLSTPEIAQAIRDGATAEEVLTAEGFMGDVLDNIMSGMVEMSDARANSIANYEIAWAENAGRHEQLSRDGFQQKAWVHLGERGITEAGNEHPCILCAMNEDLGFVPMDFLFQTVFEDAPFPPAHPGVCHCTVVFDPEELERLVEGGEFAPWVGEE